MWAIAVSLAAVKLAALVTMTGGGEAAAGGGAAGLVFWRRP